MDLQDLLVPHAGRGDPRAEADGSTTIQASGFDHNLFPREEPAHGQRLHPSLPVPLLYAVDANEVMGWNVAERRPRLDEIRVRDVQELSAAGSIPSWREPSISGPGSGGARCTGPRRCARTARGATRKSSSRAWEKQKRGLAHVHGVIAVGTPAERAWAKAYVEALREMAPRYGFGFVDGWHKVGRKFWPGEQAAAYLSSYFVRGRGHKAPISENVLAGDLPRLVVFVGRALTLQTGCTMRALRNRRKAWASQQRLAEERLLHEADGVVAARWLRRVADRSRAP
jgi:hypothetical protein